MEQWQFWMGGEQREGSPGMGWDRPGQKFIKSPILFILLRSCSKNGLSLASGGADQEVPGGKGDFSPLTHV